MRQDFAEPEITRNPENLGWVTIWISCLVTIITGFIAALCLCGFLDTGV